jgi:hypothetical protein
MLQALAQSTANNCKTLQSRVVADNFHGYVTDGQTKGHQ